MLLPPIITACPEGCAECGLGKDGKTVECTKCYAVAFGTKTDDKGVITCLGECVDDINMCICDAPKLMTRELLHVLVSVLMT